MERLRPVFTGAGWDLLCLTTLLKAFNCLGWSGLAIKSTPQETSWFSLPCKALHCSLGSFVRSWIIFTHKECIWGLLYSAFKVGGAGSHNTILRMRKVGGGEGEGPQPQPAQKCHHFCSALLASGSMIAERANCKARCHLPRWTKTTNQKESHIRPYRLTWC